MLKTFRSCSLLRKIVGETGREMKREWKKTALHHPDAYLVCNSMPGALTSGCWKDVLITWCRRPCRCPRPLYLKVPGVSQRTVLGARVACALAEGAMEMKVTRACQLKLQGAETKVKSHVIVFLATAEYSWTYRKLEFLLAKKEKEGKIGSHQNKLYLLLVEYGIFVSFVGFEQNLLKRDLGHLC